MKPRSSTNDAVNAPSTGTNRPDTIRIYSRGTEDGCKSSRRAAILTQAALLKRIEAALDRMDWGDYGFCTSCGAQIDISLLEEDPATPHCKSCLKREN